MFPIVIRRRLEGANGRNWPGLVLLDPSAPYPAAVLAQEAWEAMHKLNPANLLRIRISPDWRRDFEIMGHEVEVQAAALLHGVSAPAYRAREAETMRAGYAGLFAEMGPAEIIAAMTARSRDARSFVIARSKWLSDFL
ncbi:hypothetical protein RGQ15_13565 [Paracoccus sp. MBLB3053]|uniref:EthD domain-containing protein n=1 Tax=Paracoccus aurantius TaxID=3073814 RepID=A0ABU2HU68_9RHOB|nr:hypothetical protein [Paracoccus sp. MBLB3053]MDS9468592.1 hypothetical protein [Paracoccus sp. MBLB3053]